MSTEQEQAETVEGVREALKDGGYIMDWEDVAAKLLIIVDHQTQKIEAMQKQINAYSLATQAAGSLMQKQYTEEELREMYYRDCGDAALNMVPFEWFARFLRAIKEKEK